MKKIIVIVAFMLAACTAVSAENTTRIGSAHRVDYGAFVGYYVGSAWIGQAFIDLNAAESNFRARLNLGLEERPYRFKQKEFNFCPSVGVDAQYLLPLSEAFYVYPSVGAFYEHYAHRKVNNDFGLKAGIGLEFQISSSFGIFAEGNYKHVFMDKVKNHANRFGGQLGVILAF